MFCRSQRAFKVIVAADEAQTERKIQKENETSLTLHRKKKAEVSIEERALNTYDSSIQTARVYSKNMSESMNVWECV